MSKYWNGSLEDPCLSFVREDLERAGRPRESKAGGCGCGGSCGGRAGCSCANGGSKEPRPSRRGTTSCPQRLPGERRIPSRPVDPGAQRNDAVVVRAGGSTGRMPVNPAWPGQGSRPNGVPGSTPFVPPGPVSPALPMDISGFGPPMPPPVPVPLDLITQPEAPPTFDDITQWDPTQPPRPDPGVEPPTGPVSGTGELSGQCRLVPHPANPTVNTGVIGPGAGTIASGGPQEPPPLFPLQTMGQFMSLADGASSQAAAIATMTTAGQPGTQAGQSAADVGGLAGQLPLCPPGYYFDYNRQACYPKDDPAGPLQNGEQWVHACRCPWGYSWIPDRSECWKWGAAPVPAVFDGEPALGPGELACAPGYTWDVTEQRCVFQGCPPPLVDLGGICIDPTPDSAGLLCMPDSILTEPSSWTFQSGSCSESEKDALAEAFALAYRVCRSAEVELDWYSSLSVSEKKEYWESYVQYETSRAAYWFGGTSSFAHPHLQFYGLSFEYRYAFVRDVVKAVSRAFRRGFHPWFEPVIVHCKNSECVGNAVARHGAVNMIEICPNWWDRILEDRVTVILHEMCHHSVNASLPRDRNHPLCSYAGGTNCYADFLENDGASATPAALPGEALRMFPGGNPRALVEGFEAGGETAAQDMLRNIDNYMCWMWNRWMDRDLCLPLELAW